MIYDTTAILQTWTILRSRTLQLYWEYGVIVLVVIGTPTVGG